MAHRAFLSFSQRLALALGLLVMSSAALSERADKNKPVNIVADTLAHDEIRQTSVLEGSVVLTKGTMVIRAARIEIRKDKQENQFFVATSKDSNPVFFRQKREGFEEFMEGFAQRIEYDGKLDTVRFSGNAVMRRLRGSELADEFVGQVMVFDNLAETMNLTGTTATASAPAQRVRMMLSPNPDKSPDKSQSPASALQPSKPVPAAAPQSTGPVLRPSLQVR
jgi:lipopolysaccharide export system protein LptA